MSNMEKITVHKALAELKVIDDRIVKAINNGKYVVSNKHSNDKIGGVTVSVFRDNMKSSYQKVTDLINRRNSLKRAVVLSNARTMVTINGTEYTVAEAIDMKNHGMEIYKTLLRELNAQYQRALYELENNSGESLEKKAENYVLSVIAAQPKDSKMSIDSDAMKSLRKDYIANNTYDLIDPNEISKKIEYLTDMISEFQTEIDSVLSVSNALTIIEFEY